MRWIIVFTGLITFISGVVGGQGDGPVAPPEGETLSLQTLLYETNTPARLSALDSLAASAPLDLNIDDFYTEIEFTVDSCAGDDSALFLITRLTPQVRDALQGEAFVFVLQCSGDYRARHIIDSQPQPVAASGQTDRVVAGQRYALGVIVVENDVIWYLDGQELARFTITDPIRSSGSLAYGGQLGISLTVARWRVWSLESSGSRIDDTDTSDPLAQGGVGELVFEITTEPPQGITLGLHRPVAAYAVGTNLVLFNTEPVAILPLDIPAGPDYYLALPMRTRHCSDTSSVGLVWRASDDYQTYYGWQVQCNGTYRAFVNDGTARELASGHLGLGLQEPFHGLTLSVFVQDDQAWLYLNDTLVDTFRDATLEQGQMGIILASGDDGARMEIAAFTILGYETR